MAIRRDRPLTVSLSAEIYDYIAGRRAVLYRQTGRRFTFGKLIRAYLDYAIAAEKESEIKIIEESEPLSSEYFEV